MAILKTGQGYASTTEGGLLALATAQEHLAGIIDNKAASPAGVKAMLDQLIDGAPALLDTLNELAAAIGDDENFAVSTQNKIDNLQNQINTLSGVNLGGLQGEIDTIETGAGLNSDGSYTAPTSSNYLGSASSLKDADDKLDAQIKQNADDIASLGNGSLTAIQDEIDDIEASVGLQTDGTLGTYANTNNYSASATIKEAVEGIDAQVATNTAAISGLGSNAAITALQSEVDTTQASAGLNTDGSLPAFTNSGGGNLPIIGGGSPATSLKDALHKIVNYVGQETLTSSNDLSQEVIAHGSEIDALTVRVGDNESDIATLQSSASSNTSGVSTNASAINTVEASVGLAADGSYSAISGANYATSSSSLKAAVAQLDVQLDSTQSDLDTLEATVSSLQTGAPNQAEVDAIEAAVGINTDGSFSANSSGNFISSASSVRGEINALDTQLNTTQSDLDTAEAAISTLQSGKASTSSVTALQSELDATQSGAGLGTGGAYTAPSSSNYLGSATSLADADDRLDTQIKTNADAISNLASSSAITNLQSEVDDTQAAVGLATDGSFSANSSGNFISSASSVRGEINALDSQLSNTQSDLDTAEASLASLTTTVGNKADSSTVSSLQSEVDATQTGVGLNANGSYSAHTSSNYINGATSVKSALGLLDAQVDTNETDIAALTSTVSTLTAGSGATSGQITVLQNEIDATQTGAGLSSSGAYTAPGSSNYLGSASSLKDADDKLDAQIKTNADAIALKASTSSVNSLTTTVNSNTSSISTNASSISGNASDISSLQADVASNDSDISALQSDKASASSVTALQSEVDATQSGAGLSAAGAYSANSSSNYLTSASSLKDADDKLDAQIKTNADDIASNTSDIATNAAAISGLASNSTITAMQTEIDAIESGVGLNSDGSYTALTGNFNTASTLKGAVSSLDTQVKTNADAISSNDSDISSLSSQISSNDSDISSLQTLANTHESSIGLDSDGGYTAISGANFADSGTSLKAAVAQLDTQLKTTQDEVDAEETARANAITSVNSTISTLQSEVDATQTGAGLTSAGAYTANSGANYIDSASSLKDADDKLDTQIKANADAIASNDSDISSINSTLSTLATSSSLSSLQSEVDAIESAVGLSASGAYSAISGANYATSSSSLKAAVTQLDTQLKTTQDALDVAEAAITSNDTDIATNVSAINTVEASVGLSTAGAYQSRSGSNYLDSATSVINEATLLDAQIATNATAIATKAASSTVTALQSEVDTSQASIGLSTSGGYVSRTSTNYLNSATSIVGEITALDTQAKTNADAITSEASSRASADSTLTSAINTVEASVGLQADGSLSISGTNFLNSSSTIVAALDTLDTNQKLLSDIRLNMISALGLSSTGVKNSYANTNYISDSEDVIEAIEALDRQVSTNAGSISSLGSSNIANLQSELDDTQAGAGLGTDGTYSANSSTNYLQSVSTLKAADEALDAQIKTNADAIALKANSTTLSALDLRVEQLEISDGGVWISHDTDDEVYYGFDVECLKSHYGPFEIKLGGANGYIRALVASENATTDLIFYGTKAERNGGRHFHAHPVSGDAVFQGKFSG